jgi:hypothetical protein
VNLKDLNLTDDRSDYGRSGSRRRQGRRTFSGVADVGVSFSRGRRVDTVDADGLLLEEGQRLPRLVPGNSLMNELINSIQWIN